MRFLSGTWNNLGVLLLLRRGLFRNSNESLFKSLQPDALHTPDPLIRKQHGTGSQCHFTRLKRLANNEPVYLLVTGSYWQPNSSQGELSAGPSHVDTY